MLSFKEEHIQTTRPVILLKVYKCRFISFQLSFLHLYFPNQAVVVKVHRSSTWVKVQIRILKYYSSKSKSTAFFILLEWKYKSTQFFMYLSKKVLIDRFILQFYIDYFIKFYISTYFYNPTAQNTWVFPKITAIESRYIFCWYGLRWWEWCSNVHCEAYTAMYHLIFTSKKKVFYNLLFCRTSVIYDMRIRPEIRKNILRKI